MNHIHLSPLNLRGLIQSGRYAVPAETAQRNAAAVRAARENVIERVQAYLCPDCGELYEDLDDACECCEHLATNEEGLQACPICQALYPSLQDASDCCLWKDLDAPTRHAMAAAVAAGSTWAEQLGFSPVTH